MPQKKEKIEHYQLANILIQQNSFKTMRDNDEIYRYDPASGLYRPDGKVFIHQRGQQMLIQMGHHKEATTGFLNSAAGYITRETYVDREQFNWPDNVLIVKNGVLDMDTGKFEPHSPKHLFTTGIPVRYDPTATCPRVLQFLAEITPAEDLEVLFEIFGWCLDMHSPIQRWVILWGAGENGKSTYLRLLQGFLGDENCSHVTLHDLMSNRFSSSDLFGKRANIVADLPSTTVHEAGMLKSLTGGDTIRAERKFENPFSFRNTAKLVFSANRTPEIKEDEPAFWRRVILIDFPYRFKGDKADKQLPEKLTTERELSGLLNFALEKRKALKEREAFDYRHSEDEVKERYIQRSNPVGVFIEECCEVGSDTWLMVGKEELYQAYVRFAEEAQVEPLGKKQFGRRLKGILRRRLTEGQDKNHRSVWRGLALKD
jgi:putative DNA primase/helicase